MRIIEAKPSDVPRIMACAREFCALLKVNLNEAHYAAVWTRFMEEGRGGMFLMEDAGRIVGGIGGITADDLLTGEREAVELFWYVQPEFRKGLAPIRLLNHFEDWAAGAGCKGVAMIHMEASMPQELKLFYEKRGYRLLESHYRKTLP